MYRMSGMAAEFVALAVVMLSASAIAFDTFEGGCDYGAMPGRASMTKDGFQWRTFDPACPLENLLPEFASSSASASDIVPWRTKRSEGISMLMIGDSLNRYTIEDLEYMASKEGWPGFQNIHYDRHRVVARLQNLEAVYQFAPGSHPTGFFPYGYSKYDSVVVAVPRAFDLHRAMTGRSGPNVVIFSHILWDEFRWNHLTLVAEKEGKLKPEEMPLPRDAEILPDAIVEEIWQDALLHMIRIEELAGPDALLIYNGAPFPRLTSEYPHWTSNGTLHKHADGMLGRRPHIAELNALARQLTKQRPRWHFVDIGQMSEPFLDSAVLRDDVHPNTDVMMTVLQMYLNLHVDHGKPLPPVQFPIQGFKEWDSQDFTEKVTRWMEDYHRQKPKWLAEEVEKQRRRQNEMSRQPLDGTTAKPTAQRLRRSHLL